MKGSILLGLLLYYTVQVQDVPVHTGRSELGGLFNSASPCGVSKVQCDDWLPPQGGDPAHLNE